MRVTAATRAAGSSASVSAATESTRERSVAPPKSAGAGGAEWGVFILFTEGVEGCLQSLPGGPRLFRFRDRGGFWFGLPNFRDRAQLVSIRQNEVFAAEVAGLLVLHVHPLARCAGPTEQLGRETSPMQCGRRQRGADNNATDPEISILGKLENATCVICSTPCAARSDAGVCGGCHARVAHARRHKNTGKTRW